MTPTKLLGKLLEFHFIPSYHIFDVGIKSCLYIYITEKHHLTCTFWEKYTMNGSIEMILQS